MSTCRPKIKYKYSELAKNVENVPRFIVCTQSLLINWTLNVIDLGRWEGGGGGSGRESDVKVTKSNLYLNI